MRGLRQLLPILVSCPVSAFLTPLRTPHLRTSSRHFASLSALHMEGTPAGRPLDASVVIEPKSGKHDSCVIFLHGSGDTGDGLKQWVGGEKGPFAFESTRVVFPTAHMRKYSLLGPHGMQRVWFDRMALGPQGAEDTLGMDAMSQLVKQIVYDEVGKGVPLNRVIVGGFSMGGAQALHTVLGDAAPAREKVAGVFAMSTFLADDSVLTKRMEDVVKGGGNLPPVLYCHGEADSMIKCRWGAESAKRLEKAGAQVEWRTYPGVDHDMCAEELHGVSAWIQARLAEA